MKSPAVFSLLTTAQAVVADNGAMRDAFDSLTRFGVQLPFWRYSDDQFNAITTCMATAGSKLYPSGSDAAWTGWTDFGINGGQPGDVWSVNNSAAWMEYDPRDLSYHGHKFKIIEPCNTVSNLAYYRIVPELCAKRSELAMGDDYVDAIIQGFATLGMGSSFMHGSRTSLGGTFDNAPISVIAYQYFQLMTSSLKPSGNGSSSVLHELSVTPRAYNGRELATKIHTIPLEYELNDWHGALNALDRPQYFFTFGAIIIQALTLIAPDAINDKLIPPLMSAFGLSAEVQEFLTDIFIPTVRGATKDLHLTLGEKAALVPKFLGTLVKLLYAFIWQEQTFVYKGMYDATWNLFGKILIPTVNSLANKLTGFDHPDASIQAGDDIYPGQAYCGVKSTAPHAKWHEMSANGLMDLAYLADVVKSTIDTAQARGSASSLDADGSNVVILTTDVVDEWVAEIAAESWSEGYLTRQAFGLVVKNIAKSADKCTTGESDGSITWDDLTCYLTSIDSATGFIESLFKSIFGLQQNGLGQVHATPDAKPVFV